MKNLLKITFMLVVAGLFFSACKTASITKRHYTKGYYVSHSAKKNKVSTREQENVASVNAAETLPQKQSNLNTVADDREVVNAPVAANESPVTTAATKTKNEKRASTARNENTEELTLNEPGVKEFVKNPFKLSKAVAAKDSGDDARSLLWILIVVLLAVYILGLFMDSFGLGGLIHILGVIVLVLLILWLLRII